MMHNDAYVAVGTTAMAKEFGWDAVTTANWAGTFGQPGFAERIQQQVDAYFGAVEKQDFTLAEGLLNGLVGGIATAGMVERTAQAAIDANPFSSARPQMEATRDEARRDRLAREDAYSQITGRSYADDAPTRPDAADDEDSLPSGDSVPDFDDVVADIADPPRSGGENLSLGGQVGRPGDRVRAPRQRCGRVDGAAVRGRHHAVAVPLAGQAELRDPARRGRSRDGRDRRAPGRHQA